MGITVWLILHSINTCRGRRHHLCIGAAVFQFGGAPSTARSVSIARMTYFSCPLIFYCQAARARSQARRIKVGRLEPGDVWGMQHMHAGADADFEVLAVEACEVCSHADQ